MRQNAVQTHISFATKYTRLGWFGCGCNGMQRKLTSHSQQSILDLGGSVQDATECSANSHLIRNKVHYIYIFFVSLVHGFRTFSDSAPKLWDAILPPTIGELDSPVASCRLLKTHPFPEQLFFFFFWVSIGLMVCHIYRAFPCLISMTFSVYWLLVQLHVALNTIYWKLCSQSLFCWLCCHGHCCSIADFLTFFFFFLMVKKLFNPYLPSPHPLFKFGVGLHVFHSTHTLTHTQAQPSGSE